MAMHTPPLTGWVTKDEKRWIRELLQPSRSDFQSASHPSQSKRHGPSFSATPIRWQLRAW
jgi:hypothetical protein